MHFSHLLLPDYLFKYVLSYYHFHLSFVPSLYLHLCRIHIFVYFFYNCKPSDIISLLFMYTS
jgi:hypothetical protein